MADEAAHLRVVTEIVSAVAGDPHDAGLSGGALLSRFCANYPGAHELWPGNPLLYFRGEYRKIDTVES